jgi:cell division control protein 11
LEEDGVKLSLTLIDTPGFGDNINNENTFAEIMAFVEKQYESVLAEESRIKRNPKFQGIVLFLLLECCSNQGFR